MMWQWVLVAFVAMSCRGKDPGGAPVGSGTQPRNSQEQELTWSAVIRVGGMGVHALASGPLGTFVVTTPDDGNGIVINGKEVVAPSKDEGNAVIQFDTKGNPIWSTRVHGTGMADSLSVGSSNTVAGIEAVTLAAKGAIVTLPNKAITPVDGNVAAVARTVSGTIWLAGYNWGNVEPLAEGRCDGDPFLARARPSGVELVDCDFMWREMHLAALGEDVVMCANTVGGGKVGGVQLEGKVFLARFGRDGKLIWVRYVAEVGDGACNDVVITSDGDIVASGVANENVDFSEGAKAKGVQAKSSGGLGLDRLWLARFGADGTRRWVRPIAHSTVGFSSDLERDRNGNAVLVSGINGPLDLGHGPVGPKNGATIIATIDREGTVTGLISTGFMNSERIAIDDQDGLVFAFATSDPIRIGSAAFEPPAKGGEYVGVVRIPLPLPPP